MVPAKVLDVAQVQKAQSKSPIAVVVGHTDQPIGNLVILRLQLRLIPITGLADAKRITSPFDRHAVLNHRPSGHLSSPG